MSRSNLFLFLLNLLFYSTFAQKTYSVTDKKAIVLFEKGLEAFNNNNKLGAISFYQRAIEKEPNFAEAYHRLGQVYELSARKDLALMNYEKSIKIAPELVSTSVIYHILGINSFEKGEYSKAIGLLDKYILISPKSYSLVKKSKRIIGNATFAIEAVKNPIKINPVSLGKGVNVFHSQYFPTITADKEMLVFTGYNRTTQDENLYVSYWKNKAWTYPISLSPNINSSENEGTASISADGRTLVFTACNKKDGLGSCDLYISYRFGNEWLRAINLGENINTREWESQPSLSADGGILYFVSDRKGGIGKRDIFISKKDSVGEWSLAKNLGDQINTPEDEISPFIHPNGISLFFASDGYPGLGGMDIFYAEKINNIWSKPENFGYPINTSRDQVSLFITADNKRGYYSLEQNQDEASRNSLLYQFEIPANLSKKIKKANVIKGVVTDSRSKKKLGADIEVYNLKNNNLESKGKSDEQTGEYMEVLNQGGNYGLFVNKPGYFFKSINFDYSDETDSTAKYMDISLEPLLKNSKEILNNIYFDSNKFELKDESKPELEKLTKLLKLNPNLTIEISGHTDDIGKDSENLTLSKNRAKSVYDYLIINGLNPAQLKPIGYGETVPTVPNNSPENRAKNRRIEIKIL
jgi:outer membrane protein OmpA-like peptidoglycan-associated protein